MSLKDTTTPPAPNPPQEKISDMSILIDKKFLPLNRFRPLPLQWKVHLLNRQYFSLILMFLLPFAKVNSLVLIILSLILFHMMILLHLFTSLPYLYPLYLYSGRMRRLYWYQPGSRLWMRRWMLLFLEKLGSWSLHSKMMLWVIDGSIPWSIALMVQWIGISPGWLPKDILRPMAWTTLRLFHQLLGWTLFEFCFLLLLYGVTLISTRCWECLSLWGLKGASLYGATSRVYCSGEILSVDSGRRSMSSNRVQGHDLRSSAWLSVVLDLLVVIRITQCLFVVQSLA